MGAKRELATFDYRLHQRLAELIHRYFCEDRGWCNYGKPEPEEMRHDDSFPWEEQQTRARMRLDWYRHCEAAVDAENIAARVQFARGSKVRKR